MASLMSSEEMMSRIGQLEVDSLITKAEVIDILKQFEVQKEAMQDAIQREFAQTRNRIDILVNDVRAEVKILNEKRDDLLNQTARAVDQLDSRLNILEVHGGPGVGGGNGGREDRQKGYLPLKSTIPESLGNAREKWRSWKRDALGYFDTITKGMKAYLLEIEKQPEDITADWAFGEANSRGALAATATEHLWRAFASLTVDEPRKIIEATPDDGWNAWRRLCQHFNPSLASMEGRAWSDLGTMAQNIAKSPEETKKMINELSLRIKHVEDISGEKVADTHAKSILLTFMDSITRQHTATYHGKTND